MTSNNKKKAHVVLLTLKPVFNIVGGVEKVFCAMSSALSDLGYNVTPLVYDKNKDGEPIYPVTVNLVNVYSEPEFSFSEKLFKPLIKFSLNKNKRWLKKTDFIGEYQARCLKESLQRLPHIDIFICFQIEASYVLKKFLGIQAPVITMLHGQPSNFIEKIKLCDKYLSQTSCMQVLLPSYIKQIQSVIKNTHVVCIPNAVNESNLQVDYSNHLIITTSRLCTGKRPDLLIKAFALIKDQFPSWRCEWWGPFQDEKIFEDMVRHYSLENRFYLKGATDHVNEKLSQASIYAFPSGFEGFPLGLTEAMSLGLPVVGCNDCEAVRALVCDGRNGLLASPTPESIAKVLAKLMADIELREHLGQQARKDMKNFTPEVVWGQWQDLIDKVIRGNVV